ncbi:DUF1707 domain-containing protein [Amycolatopsis sp. BJA-103]|uniref:DUF1707 SHOCT-like domain-containing protein n=1 Tax=unclassified Amycolatopsis TaxID=2618356 RepID=UPI000C777138|nr:DUF1707 domain-containing protein [Amycolatopsis sp. BJA-103]AUI59840.1 hypothetical protein BKN51_17585 [Amycolatopsis sp. BJA-103]PNE14634.1 hypothetical protein B1H26_34020 [Amycolatopsis sp. BJA-103]
MSQHPGPEEMRVGTAEREEAARLLADHYSQGRITPDEYEGRVLAAYEAATVGELRPLFQDLPAPHPACFTPRFTQPVHAYRQPAAMVPYSPKSKVTAGVLQIVLPFGTGRFYTGHVGIAFAQLAVAVFTCGIGVAWPIVDGIVLLANGGTDPQGRRLHD